MKRTWKRKLRIAWPWCLNVLDGLRLERDLILHRRLCGEARAGLPILVCDLPRGHGGWHACREFLSPWRRHMRVARTRAQRAYTGNGEG